ncbi:DUF5320 domain-containing protein [candidate division KSB1 bacterium]|nr:DUF5320 domain-containing protein [candidate division KSB1 bacterium]
MPAGDRTGPQGRGPLTGRGLGSCGTPNNQIPMNQQNLNWGQRLISGIGNTFRMRRGGGMERGRGRGMGIRGDQGRNR